MRAGVPGDRRGFPRSALQRGREAEAARYTGLARMYQMQERIALTGQE